jgi:phospholipase/lecithinase/hemolysin
MNKKILATGFVLFSFMLPLKAMSASKFTGLYVFGDSLSDTGNVFNATGQQLPPESLGYFDGRFSNGPNWVDYLAQNLGLSTPTPITEVLAEIPPTDGINFAFGGATTFATTPRQVANTIDPRFPGLLDEVGLFAGSLIQNNRSADKDALYIVWAGANDYLPTTSPFFTPPTTPDRTIANLVGAVTTLASVGAKNIMLVNLPDLGETPRARSLDPFFPPVVPGESARLNALTEAHNALLPTTFGKDVNLISLDINALFSDIINRFNTEPTRSPFTNVTDPCIVNPFCTDPNQFLFWDGIHPTTAAHQIIGQFAFKKAASIPEPTSGFGILAFGILGFGARLKRKPQKPLGE